MCIADQGPLTVIARLSPEAYPCLMNYIYTEIKATGAKPLLRKSKRQMQVFVHPLNKDNIEEKHLRIQIYNN